MILIVRLRGLLHRVFDDQEGASLVEYAFLIMLIAVVAVIAVTTFGTSLSDKYSEISDGIP